MTDNGIKPHIEAMAIGDTLVFPIERTISVRATASLAGALLARQYKTKTDRVGRTISVTRSK